MKMFTKKTAYDDTIVYAQQLTGTYDAPVIFHCYWNTTKNGGLSEKHLYSILSCWYFNVRNNKHKIILWLENTELNEYAEQIKQYAEIRQFEVDKETQGTFLEGYEFEYKEKRPGVKYYSDYVRQILLYNYGGCWFDLDCFFLRCFDPLFATFPDDLCFYDQTGCSPNNAVILSLRPRAENIEKFMKYMVKRDLGWSFFHPFLTYDEIRNEDVDILILPCSWFDPMGYLWYHNVPNWPGKKDFIEETSEVYTFDNFYQGAFCYHWHNYWRFEVGQTSTMSQLVKIIESDLNAAGQKQDETRS